MATFVPHSFGKILRRDHLCLTKHILCNQSCILMSSFAALSHNIDFGHWEKKNSPHSWFFFLFPLTFSSLPWLQNMTFHFFIQDVVGPRLEAFYISKLPTRERGRRKQRYCGCRLWVQLGVWRETSILMMEMSPALLFEGRLMWKIPVQWEQSHHWSCVDNSHRVIGTPMTSLVE